MKLVNELLVFDLEATSNQEQEGDRPKHQVNNSIIEIGAVLLDRDLKEVGEFQHFVRPREEITPFIANLTSITNEMVAHEPEWLEVGAKLEAWASSLVPNLRSVRLCAWGNYFDVPLLRKCYRDYDMKYPWSGTAFDCKTIAMLWCSLSGKRTDKLSVSHLASLMGIKPEGQYHRAITDAQVQARIVQRVFNDLSQGYFLPHENKPYEHIRITRSC